MASSRARAGRAPTATFPSPTRWSTAYADAQLALGNEINAATFRQRAQQWRHDLATRDHCDGCYPGLVQDFARAGARIAELEAQIAAANAALRPAA